MNAVSLSWFAVPVVAVLALGTPAAQARPKVRAVARLAAAEGAPDARGRARLVLRSDEQGRLRIAVRGLLPHAPYDVVIGDVRVAALDTNGSGGGRVRLSTDPRGRDALLGVDPRGKTVVIRNAAGADVLAGEIDGGPDDPAAVACCLARSEDDGSDDDGSDDDGSEDGPGEDDGKPEVRRHGRHGEGGGEKCLDLTPEQCAAEGGVAAAADSCIPNPCGDAPVADGVVCCLSHASPDGAFLRDADSDDGSDDESDDGCHVGCKDIPAAACAEKGGTVVEADTCDPNPCAPVAPAE
jgi:hypothetical protein